MSDDIATRLAAIEANQEKILEMLEKIIAPATQLSAAEKAAAIRDALATGDSKIYRETLRQVNGG